ncbi:chemotaxis protein CheA [Cognatishimia sp. WU-CL00825]|uniref:cell envelope biogenesis protein TolA n=1 Tax=Cognatishimia sp. WU-CL00825 TaxID=3127658 RepID=UPI0031088C45
MDIITTEQFDAIQAVQRPPSAKTSVDEPVAPEVDAQPPQDPLPIVPPAKLQQPDEATPSLPDQTPNISAPSPVFIPEATPPEVENPVIEPEPSAPVSSVRPVARPVRRIAPEPVAAPEPDAQLSELDQVSTTPADTPAEVVEEKDATARPETATEIPTEPTEVASAPIKSIRPKLRPAARPAATRTSQADVSSEPGATTNTDAAVNAAMAAAMADLPATPSGPPLAQGEKDALRVSVEQCWVIDPGSLSANVVVVVGMSLDRDGSIVGNSIRRISTHGGDEASARAAFEAVRRAVLRCQRGGFNLPAEKYDSWREIELTFNPENMRRR